MNSKMRAVVIISSVFLLALLLAAIAATASAATISGADVLKQRGCADCHNLTGPSPQTYEELWERKAPDLYYAGNKYKQKWLEEWLEHPQRIRPAGMYYGKHIKPGPEHDVVDPDTLKPHIALSDDEARAVAAELMSYKAKSDLIKPGDYQPGTISMSMGEMMFDKFRGCLACHQIEPGYGGMSGPEVYTAAERLQEDYLVSFMRNPTAWDPKIFMPSGYIREPDLQKFVHYFRGLSEEGSE